MADDGRQSARKRGYNRRWEKARATYLRSHPLCVMHQELGQLVPAAVVDHKVPHRGDQVLFWDQANWQSLCKACHDSHKQRLERSGGTVGCDVDGLPLAPNHHWRRVGG